MLLYFHGSETSGAHSSRDDTVQKLSELVWWPTLYHDVERWVSTCSVCKLTQPQKALTAEMRSQLYLRPFRVLIIDTVGPITPAVRGFEFIYHASCPFSGFAWLQAAAKNDGPTWSQFLVEQVFFDIAGFPSGAAQ